MERDFWDYLLIISQIVGSLGTAGALIFTYKHLIELRKQTDLANDPILKIRIKKIAPNADKELTNMDYFKNGPHDCWQKFITRNLEQDLGGLKDTYLTLELKNAGKSEITKVNIFVIITVKMLENDVLGVEINPTNYEWELSDFNVELGDHDPPIMIPLANSKYFPDFALRIRNISYWDVRGQKRYTNYDGPPIITEVNEILRPVKRDSNIQLDLDDRAKDDDLPF